MNTMTINGHQAVIAFDPEIQMFRGEFVGLNGSMVGMPGQEDSFVAVLPMT